MIVFAALPRARDLTVKLNATRDQWQKAWRDARVMNKADRMPRFYNRDVLSAPLIWEAWLIAEDIRKAGYGDRLIWAAKSRADARDEMPF